MPLPRQDLCVAGRLIGCGEAKLTGLQTPALGQLLSTHAQSPALLCRLSGKLLRGQALSAALEEPGLRQLLGGKPRLSSKLLC